MPYYNEQRNMWMAQVKYRGLKYRSQHQTKAEAKRWEVEKLRQLASSDGQPVPILTLSLFDFASRYLDHAQAQFSQKTYKEKQLAFRRLFLSVSPEIQVTQLHKGQVLAHFRREAAARSGYAANKDRKNLVAAWNWAVKYIAGFFAENPFLTERFPEVRTFRKVPTVQDFWAVYEVAESDQDKTMLLAYLHLAARRNEIFHLRREDVDLVNRKVRLCTRKRKDGSLHYDWLPLTDRLHGALADHLALAAGEWVFPDPVTGLPYVARQRWLHRLCAKAQVDAFGLHGIRHLSASILIQAKVSLLDVQLILRHQNLTTTQRYVHRLQSVRSAVEVFDSI